MAGQFYYNPGVSDQRGAIMAAGISQAGNAISNAIVGYRQAKKEKEAEQAAVDWITANGAKWGINTQDKGEVKAAVKAAGGGPQALAMIQNLERGEKQMQLQEEQLKALQEEGQQRAADKAARAAALANGQPSTMDDTEAVMAYLKAGGSEKGAAELAQTMAFLEKIRGDKTPFKPTLMDLGGGVSAMTTSKGSAVPIAKGEPKPATETVEIGGRRYTVGPGGRYFDEKGNPVDFGQEKPMSATDWVMSGQDPAGYREYREKFSKATGAASEPAKGEPDDKAKGAEPKEIKTQAEFDKLPKGARFIFNGKIGVKK